MQLEKSLEKLGADRFQVIRIYLNCGMLVDQLKRQHKTEAVAPSNQSSFEALHDTVLDSNPFANDEFAVRFNSVGTGPGAKKIYIALPQGNGLSAISNNPKHSGRLKNPYALSQVDAHKEVSWEERYCELDSLAIFPATDSFVGWKKSLDLADAKLLES